MSGEINKTTFIELLSCNYWKELKRNIFLSRCEWLLGHNFELHVQKYTGFKIYILINLLLLRKLRKVCHTITVETLFVPTFTNTKKKWNICCTKFYTNCYCEMRASSHSSHAYICCISILNISILATYKTN